MAIKEIEEMKKELRELKIKYDKEGIKNLAIEVLENELDEIDKRDVLISKIEGENYE